MQVFLLHEEADEQAVEAGVEVPVEEAEVVADDVVAVVGELDALPLALAAALALHAAHKDLARHQLELFEPGQELGFQERFRLRLGHRRPLSAACGLAGRARPQAARITRAPRSPRPAPSPALPS